MRRLSAVLMASARVLRAWLFERYIWQDTFVNECIKLGGVYIKFIQMLAVHETTKQLVSGVSADIVYEQVPYELIDVARELGRKRMAQFAAISPRPIAAGSYGQVYSARLVFGESVVIKVLRPSIRRTLRQDLRILNVAAWWLGLFSKAAIVDIKSVVQEFSRVTYGETNYVGEAENGEWLRAYFSRRGSLVIPRSFRDLTSRYVLVQEQVGDISLASAMSRQRGGERIDTVVYEAVGSNIWQQLDTLGEESMKSLLYADYQMADPHPGNIRLLPDNKVAFIDFGMVSKAPRNRSAFVNMIGEYIKVYEDRFEPGAFAVSMLAFFDMELYGALSLVAREWDDDYMKSLETFIGKYVSSLSGDGLTQHYILERRMGKLFDQVINQNNKLGIRISRENIMLQRSMNMYLSIVRAIGEAHDGAINFQILHTVSSRVYQQALKDGFDQPSLPAMSEERAYEVTANWLTLVAQKDRRLYRFITERSFA